MLVTSKVCMRKDLGLNGYLFGGKMMSWMDEAAYLYARIVTDETTLVTMRFGEMKFRKPVKEGDVVCFYCSDEKFTASSVTFKISAMSGGKKSDEIFNTECTFVSIDKTGHKKVLKRNVVQTN